MRTPGRSMPATIALLAASVATVARGAGQRGLCAAAGTGSTAPYVAVVSAYPAELAPIVAASTIERSVQIGGRSFYVGRLGGVNVLLGLTGIGLVNAADTTHSLLARRDVVGLVMSGTCGTRFDIGDVMVPGDLVETGRRGVFRPNPALVAIARRAAPALPEPLDRCTVVPPGSPTGAFVCLLTDPVVRFDAHAVSADDFGGKALPCTPGGGEIFGCDLPAPAVRGTVLAPATISTQDVEDNESAAVARVAVRRRVPFLVVRSASDGGGDPKGNRGFPAEFFDYYRIATHNAADLTRAVVTELGRLAGDPTAAPTCRLLAGRRWQRAARQLAAAQSQGRRP
jgi:nucleoside phosphorylase